MEYYENQATCLDTLLLRSHWMKDHKSVGCHSPKTLRLTPGCLTFQGLTQGLLCEVTIQMALNVDISFPAGLGRSTCTEGRSRTWATQPSIRTLTSLASSFLLVSLLQLIASSHGFFFFYCASHILLLFCCFCLGLLLPGVWTFSGSKDDREIGLNKKLSDGLSSSCLLLS